jgi:four helix bundle protein
MATIPRFEDLEVWQLARKLNKRIYELTCRDAFKRDFKLVDQMRGSVGSTMDNAAEGFERNNNREFYYFLRVAKGSTGELRSQLYGCLDRGFIQEPEFLELKQECEFLSGKQRNFMDYLKRVNEEEAKRKRIKGGT